MISDLDEAKHQVEFRRAIIGCIRLHRATLSGVRWSDALRRSVETLRALLGRIWGAFAQIYAARTTGWEADSANPGYLIRRARHAKVRVPYHLAPDFPADRTLDDLTDLALAIRTIGQGAICLSGSSTFWEALRIVADVDFCEYVPFAVVKAKDPLLRRLRALSKTISARAFCTGAKVYDINGLPLSLDTVHDPAAVFRAKLDFIAPLTHDVVEATNLVLPITKGEPADPALKLSYALQEAPISSGTWVPRELLDPLAIGRYADWLQSEVRGKWDSDLIKAAKRGLSLARITGHAEHGDRLISILQTGTGLIEVALEARAALIPEIEKLVQSRPDIGQPLMKALRRTTRKLNGEITARRSRLDRRAERTNNESMVSLKDTLILLLRDISEGVRDGA